MKQKKNLVEVVSKEGHRVQFIQAEKNNQNCQGKVRVICAYRQLQPCCLFSLLKRTKNYYLSALTYDLIVLSWLNLTTTLMKHYYSKLQMKNVRPKDVDQVTDLQLQLRYDPNTHSNHNTAFHQSSILCAIEGIFWSLKNWVSLKLLQNFIKLKPSLPLTLNNLKTFF